MKKSLLFGILILTICALPVKSSVTVEETTDPEYIINSGYSEATAEDIFVQKNRMAGKPAEPLYDKNQKGVVKFVKGFFSYLDPSRDTTDRIHHDIKRNPSYSDL